MKNIVDTLTKKYDFSKNLVIESVLQEKDGRFIYKLSDGEKSFILKVFSQVRSEESINTDTFALHFLNERAFAHTPLIVSTKNNERYTKIGDNFAYVLEYIEGEKPENTIENWSKLGDAVARLHNIQDYPYESKFTFKQEKDVLQNMAEQFVFKDDFLSLVDKIPNFDTFPKVFIHSDIGLHNSIKKGSGEIILIDWDDAGMQAKVLDLAYPLLTQFLDDNLVFHGDIAQSYYYSYLKRGTISDMETEALFEIAVFFCLIYLPYGDIEKGWNKIKYALKNKRNITNASFGKITDI